MRYSTAVIFLFAFCASSSSLYAGVIVGMHVASSSCDCPIPREEEEEELRRRRGSTGGTEWHSSFVPPNLPSSPRRTGDVEEDEDIAVRRGTTTWSGAVVERSRRASSRAGDDGSDTASSPSGGGGGRRIGNDGGGGTPSSSSYPAAPFFTESISHFAVGLARVSKVDLMNVYDFGVPINPDSHGMDAIVLYNAIESLPSDEGVARAVRRAEGSTTANDASPPPLLSAHTATENCDTMNVVLTNNPGNTRQCLVLVGGQYQSYHVQRWARRPDENGPLDPGMSLKLTSRGWNRNGRRDFVPPNEMHVREHRERLLTYLAEADGIKMRLRRTLEGMERGSTVVVLTCNLGQSELLLNFVCSARARGLDLRNVIVFPTDVETRELAEGMGLITFYEEHLMASIPKEEAAAYGDKVFSSVMFAKVLCVQLVNELGYDLLFQDVDVVWYRPPLDFFLDKSMPKFDVYFQDDGSRQERYAPYSANSGFYFARSNPKTRHLFKQLLYSSDLISAWRSHQSVLIALLAEHSSVMGLTVKIFPKEMEELPGGLQFHRKRDTMKKLLSGNSTAYIFHMSWTENKDDKVEFFQQMGEWYLDDKCIGNGSREIIEAEGGGVGNRLHGILSNHCCSTEPLITCHYRDKPSKIPCPDSPLIIETAGKSFYKAFAPRQVGSFW